jgi:hypothetical protein
MGPAYRLGPEQDIMYEIIKSGPVQGTAQHLRIFYQKPPTFLHISDFYTFHALNTQNECIV